MSYLIDGIRHCDLKWSFFSADYDAKKIFSKIDHWIVQTSRWKFEHLRSKKFFFLKSIETLWKLFQTEKKLSKKSHRPWFLLKTIPSMRNRLSNYQIGSTNLECIMDCGTDFDCQGRERSRVMIVRPSEAQAREPI